MKRITVVTVLMLACGRSPLLGHEILGPVQVNQSLKSIQLGQTTLQGNGAASAKEEALFKIGAEAYALMKLINSEISEHGAEADRGLIDLAVKRCKVMGVNIQLAAGKDYYLYDFDAFASYLKLAPRGPRVPEVRFALIEKAFYDERRGPRTPQLLLKQIDEKKQLLQEFPSLGRRADLEVFLILDYLELSTGYQDRNDRAKSTQYKDLALELCRQVMKNYPDTGAGDFARELLLKFGL